MSPPPSNTATSRDSKLTVSDDHATADTVESEDGAEGEDETDSSNSEPETDSDAIPHASQSADIPPTATEPPLPDEDAPPLPDEELPTPVLPDDGWAPVWEESAQAFYFFNRFTGATQWTNPRVPDALPASTASAPGVDPPLPETAPKAAAAAAAARPAGGYDPAIHGDYDSNAWYAQESPSVPDPALDPSTGALDPAAAADAAAQYGATGAFNRFTGRWQAADVGPETHNDENKSRRQMSAFFDVDAAANSHDGRSLKAERSGKKLSRTEVKQFKEKRKAKKEEKRRAWLRD